MMNNNKNIHWRTVIVSKGSVINSLRQDFFFFAVYSRKLALSYNLLSL